MVEEMSKGFHDVLPIEQANQVTQIAESVSENYEIDEIISPEEMHETEEILNAYFMALKIEGKNRKTIEHSYIATKKAGNTCSYSLLFDYVVSDLKFSLMSFHSCFLFVLFLHVFKIFGAPATRSACICITFFLIAWQVLIIIFPRFFHINYLTVKDFFSKLFV